MIQLFKRFLLIVLLAVVGVATLPIGSVSALGSDDPKPVAGEISNEKLEKAWARQLKMYERMGHTDEFVARIQALIEKASAKGKDVSAVQVALDAFSDAANEAKPIHASMSGIINSHQGFDANGKVTDLTKAKETVQAMREKLQEIKTIMDGTGKALHEALNAFRAANPRP